MFLPVWCDRACISRGLMLNIRIIRRTNQHRIKQGHRMVKEKTKQWPLSVRQLWLYMRQIQKSIFFSLSSTMLLRQHNEILIPQKSRSMASGHGEKSQDKLLLSKETKTVDKITGYISPKSADTYFLQPLFLLTSLF